MLLQHLNTCPPSLCSFITLITYQFLSYSSPVPVSCQCQPSGQPALAYPSPTYIVGLSTYVIKSFWTSFRSFYPPTNRFWFFFTKVFFTPPPSPLSPIFHFPLPFSPSRLASASLLLCLLVFCVTSVALWSYGWVGLKGKVCVPVSHTLFAQSYKSVIVLLFCPVPVSLLPGTNRDGKHR